MSSALMCERCGVRLEAGRGDFYVVKITAVADPAPPILDEEADAALEIKRLLRMLAHETESEALGQVYSHHLHRLCAACYKLWIEQPFGEAGASY